MKVFGDEGGGCGGMDGDAPGRCDSDFFTNLRKQRTLFFDCGGIVLSDELTFARVHFCGR